MMTRKHFGAFAVFGNTHRRFDTIYIDIENTRLKNADVEQNYLKKFGALIIELTEQENDIKLNNERLSVVLRSPGYLTDEELEKQVFETLIS